MLSAAIAFTILTLIVAVWSLAMFDYRKSTDEILQQSLLAAIAGFLFAVLAVIFWVLWLWARLT